MNDSVTMLVQCVAAVKTEKFMLGTIMKWIENEAASTILCEPVVKPLGVLCIVLNEYCRAGKGSGEGNQDDKRV